MKILWVNPSFLDYRVPVYAELDRLTGGKLRIIYSKTRTPSRVSAKIETVLGERAIGLEGERSIGLQREDAEFANAGIRIPYQPGLLNRVMSTQADVVIAEGFFQWTPAALIKRLCQHVPLVISYERTRHTERACPGWRTRYRKLVVRMAAAMVCNGALSKEYSVELGMPASRITTGQMVVDVGALQQALSGQPAADRAHQRQRLGVQGLCFLYVGAITARKGIRQMLAAWKRFVAALPGPVTLLVAGDGPERAAIENDLSRYGNTSVKFIGPIEYEHLPFIYSAADVFVMPTLEDNWSLVVPEAMACGLPILCSKYNGCWPELVRCGDNGWIFDPLIETELSDLFHQCVNGRADLPRLGMNSRAIIADHTPGTAAESILQACQLAVEPRRSGRQSASPPTVADCV